MTESRFGNGEDDKSRLLNFVSELNKFLDEIIKKDNGKNKYFISDLYEPMKAAWEMQENHFSEINSKIDKAPVDNLERHGLQGDELTFKFSVINHYWSKFHKFESLSSDDVEMMFIRSASWEPSPPLETSVKSIKGGL